MQKILDKLSCPYKAYLNSLSLRGDTDKTYTISKFLKEIYTTYDFKDLASDKDVRPLVEEALKDVDFIMEKEEETTRETLIDHVVTFSKEMVGLGAKVIDKNLNVKLKIGMEDCFKRFDLVLQFPNDNHIYCCTLHNTHSAALSCTSSEKNSVEWTLQTMFAEEAYPGKNAVPVSITFFPKTKNFAYKDYFHVMDINNTKMKLPVADCKKVISDVAASIGCMDKTGDAFNDCTFCPGRALCEYYESTSKDLKVIKKQKVTGSVLLTKSQASIVNSDPGIYRILAGAGTGKTTALSNKIVAMVQDGIDPKDILIITFSEKGTTELKEKLDYWLKEWFLTEVSSNDFEIYNFNGYGQKILEEEYTRFGYTAPPTVIDDIRKMDIIKTLIDTYPEIENADYINPMSGTWKGANGVLKKVGNYITQISENLNDPIKKDMVYQEIKKNHPNTYDIVGKIIDEYFVYLKQNNLIVYEQQIEALVRLCTVGYEDLMEKYSRPDIICDEFQDTNSQQLQFIKGCTMQPDFHSLTMCGDDSQSVYTWRGADKKVITRLEKEFPTLVDVKMTENFRSTAEIVDLANKFNDLDKDVIKKTLSSTKHGKPVQLFDVSGKGTPTATVDLVKHFVSQGYKLSDIAVIARRKQELQQISKELQKAGYPVVYSVTEYLKDIPKVQALCSFSKYLLDNEKTLYLAEYLQAKDVEEFERQADIEKYVGVTSESIKDETENLDDLGLVDYFMSKLDEMAKDDRNVECLAIILKDKSFKNMKEVEEFLSKMRKYEADFMIDKDEQTYDGVTLMTAHASKGREFKCVIGVLDRFFFNLGDDNQCAFVMLTRAMEELILIQDLGHALKKYDPFFYTIEKLLR